MEFIGVDHDHVARLCGDRFLTNEEDGASLVEAFDLDGFMHGAGRALEGADGGGAIRENKDREIGGEVLDIMLLLHKNLVFRYLAFLSLWYHKTAADAIATTDIFGKNKNFLS
jgi:hypothetical protein